MVVILERDKEAPPRGTFEYRLLATNKTGTLQKELTDAGSAGYEFVGMTVADTLVGGHEVSRSCGGRRSKERSTPRSPAFAPLIQVALRRGRRRARD